MTSVRFENEFGDIDVLKEVYEIPNKDTKSSRSDRFSEITPFEVVGENEGAFPHETMKDVEKRMIDGLEAKQLKVLSVKSELISKRRYKRRLAKENKRRTKFA